MRLALSIRVHRLGLATTLESLSPNPSIHLDSTALKAVEENEAFVASAPALGPVIVP